MVRRTQLAGTSGSRAWHSSPFSSGCRRLTRFIPSGRDNPNPDKIGSGAVTTSPVSPKGRLAPKQGKPMSRGPPAEAGHRLARGFGCCGGSVELGTTIPLIWRLSSDQRERIHGVRRVRIPVSGRRDTWTDERTAGLAHNVAVRVPCPSNPEPSNAVGLDAASRRNLDNDVCIFLSVSGCMHGLKRV
jgi:hypothetical protein